jgi:hypothetical protein
MKEGDNRPYSELYREAANIWNDADAAARMLEECKTVVLEERKSKLSGGGDDMPDSHRERIIKSSPEWKDYIVKMVRARTAANKARINLRYIEMKAWEQRSEEATHRAEARLAP